jgi:predicted nucleic-acid-binding Zn-ribbon protein
MSGSGDYRLDPSEGITRIEDLPPPKVLRRSRNFKRRPCPRCGQSAYRDRQFQRTLHNLGDLLTGRPHVIRLTYSQHYCSRCREYFNADTTDLAPPGSHYTHRVSEGRTARFTGSSAPDRPVAAAGRSPAGPSHRRLGGLPPR